MAGTTSSGVTGRGVVGATGRDVVAIERRALMGLSAASVSRGRQRRQTFLSANSDATSQPRTREQRWSSAPRPGGCRSTSSDPPRTRVGRARVPRGAPEQHAEPGSPTSTTSRSPRSATRSCSGDFARHRQRLDLTRLNLVSHTVRNGSNHCHQLFVIVAVEVRRS